MKKLQIRLWAAILGIFIASVATVAGQSIAGGTAASSSTTPKTEIYMGILSYGGSVKNLSQGFVPLNPNGKRKLLDYIDGAYTLPEPGSALYYAVETALINVDQAKTAGDIPKDADVVLITISGGFDTGSTNPGLPAIGGGASRQDMETYRDSVSQQVRDKTKAAVAISIEGQNPSALARNSLSYVSTSNIDNSMTTLKEAIRLNRGVQRLQVTLSTSVFPHGTQVRIIFDGKNPVQSASYVDAAVSRQGDAYSLTGITAKGVQLPDATEAIQGTLGKTDVQYQFSLTGQIDPARVTQWYNQPGSADAGQWLINREPGSLSIDNAYFEFPEQKSTVIYVILDCSTSMRQELTGIKGLGQSFIEKIYSETSVIQSVQMPNAVAVPMPALGTSQSVAVPRNPQPQPPLAPTQSAKIYTAGYQIQMGAFSNPEHAEYIRQKLATQQIPASVSLAMVGRTQLYRVRTNPFSTLAQAEDMLRRIRSLDAAFADSFIVQ
jgi:cell division septation protein DedD